MVTDTRSPSAGDGLQLKPATLFLRYDLMQQCWKENPAERPSFTIIREQLERMMLQQCPYLDMADAHSSYTPLYEVDSDKETELENTAL